MKNSLSLVLIFLEILFIAPSFAKPMDETTFTQIKIFTPWGYPPSDTPYSSIKVSEKLTGSCWTNSIANSRPDAYRCAVQNQIFDPCFSNGNSDVGGKVACIKSPWDRDATVITLTASLPPVPKQKTKAEEVYLKGKPWAIELLSGLRCAFDMTGTVPSYANLTTNATCFDPDNKVSTAVAFDMFDRKMQIWLVLIKQEDLWIEQMPVKTVWY